MTLQLISNWSGVLFLALAAALLSWWLYRREVKASRIAATAGSSNPARWILPVVRAVAVFLIVLTLMEPTLEKRFREGDPGKALFLIDSSQSMSNFSESTTGSEQLAGYMQATEILTDKDVGLLSKFEEDFPISIARTSTGNVETLWSSAESEERDMAPDSLIPVQWDSQTQLGDALLAASSLVNAGSELKSESEDKAKNAIVLFSDGQNNSGESPLQAAEALAAANTQVFVVGLGPTKEPDDIGLISVNTPDRVYRTDTLQGVLNLSERLPPGTRCTATISHAGSTVWEKEFVAQRVGDLELNFAFPIEPVYTAELERLSDGLEYHMLPIQFDVAIACDAAESNEVNNTQASFVSVLSQRSRLLLIDGRSRWDSRYLKNLFSRDPGWKLTTVIGHGINAQADIIKQLPDERSEWFSYNAILLGDVNVDRWPDNLRQYLADFVQLRGGGLVIIDGMRNNLRKIRDKQIRELIPITWEKQDYASAQLPKKIKPTDDGKKIDALSISDPGANDSSESQLGWTKVAEIIQLQPISPLPGSEVLLEAEAGGTSHPLLVTRRTGAGRVLYLATEDSWRWRYRVADEYHSRIWKQLVRWCMRKPMAVEGDFVSLDLNAASFQKGNEIELRARLQKVLAGDGKQSVYANIRNESGDIVRRVSMQPDANVPGLFQTSLTGLPIGNYTVSTESAGYSAAALDVSLPFSIAGETSRELQRLSRNDTLLREIANRTGGEYLAASESDRLVELLSPIAGGKVVRVITPIWQTFGWFFAAMSLLVIDWIFRKRVGLI